MPDNIFTYLDQVRLRPGMYIHEENPAQLEPIIYGYYSGLSTHGIIEEGPKMIESHFATWLSKKIRVSGMALGWGYMLEEKFGTSKDVLHKFFDYLDEYRNLECRSVACLKTKQRDGSSSITEIYNYNETKIYYPVYNQERVGRVISGVPKPITDLGAVETFSKRNDIPLTANWHLVT